MIPNGPPKSPIDGLDHLEENEGESIGEQEALALQKKGKCKGIKGRCFNCGMTSAKLRAVAVLMPQASSFKRCKGIACNVEATD